MYDLKNRRGYVAVGTSADTAEFAVESIASWWQEHGSKSFPGAGKLLILADAGVDFPTDVGRQVNGLSGSLVLGG